MFNVAELFESYDIWNFYVCGFANIFTAVYYVTDACSLRVSITDNMQGSQISILF